MTEAATIQAPVVQAPKTPEVAINQLPEKEKDKNALLHIQPRLTVGAPDDPYEKEADSVADKVMNESSPAIQRKCAACAHEEKDDMVKRMPQTPMIQRTLAVTNTPPPTMPANDAARSIPLADKITHFNTVIQALCPSFTVNSSGSVVPVGNPPPTPATLSAGSKPVACCGLSILTASAVNNWEIRMSQLLGPHTDERDHSFVLQPPQSDIGFGHFTAAGTRAPLNDALIAGHEMIGHGAQMELNIHNIGDEDREAFDHHDPTVRVQNAIALEQGISPTEARGSARSGVHRGESFGKVEVKGFTFDRHQITTLPQPEQDKLALLAQFILANELWVDITGHSDPVGSASAKQDISDQRALAVRNHLISLGVTAFFSASFPSYQYNNRRRYTQVRGVSDTEPPLVGAADHANWRRAEIFVAGHPAGAAVPPRDLPTINAATPGTGLPAARSSSNPCHQLIANTAFPPPPPAVTPPAPVQPKLKVDNADSPLEKEADAVADTVMRMPATNFVQRKCAECEKEEEEHVQRKPGNGHSFFIQTMSDEVAQRKCAECEKEEEHVHRKPLYDGVSFVQRKGATSKTIALPVAGVLFVQKKCAECEKEEEEKLHRKPLSGPLFIQAKANGDTPAVSDSLSQSIQSSRGSGFSMDKGTQSFMSERIGADFSGVNIHTGSHASKMNSELEAKAFTVGSDIYFNEGEYQPHSDSGKRLLAHELTHVVQQNGGEKINREPTLVDPDFTMYSYVPTQESTKANLDFLKMVDPASTRLLIISGGRINVYDVKDTLLGSFLLKDTVSLPNWYFYVDSALFYPIAVDKNNVIVGMSKIQPRNDAEKKQMEKMDEAFDPENWFVVEAEKEQFYKIVGNAIYGLAVAPLATSGGAGKDGPVLSTSYPDWFKQLKTNIETLLAEERKNNPENPDLPDAIYFYGSDKVQIHKGTDAWTIEVEKGKREAYLTVTKAQWDAKEDKDTYTKEVLGHLYGKVKLMVDQAEIEQTEQKEIHQIDGTGGGKPNKWAWAQKLKREIESLLATAKSKEKDAKDFPDQLSLGLIGEGEEAKAHLRVWAYKEKKEDDAEQPELAGGTLPTALQENDRAAEWVPIVRRAAEAIRKGNVTDNPNAPSSDEGSADGDASILPPYPSRIQPFDLSPDRTTATIASNNFRMMVDTAAVHRNSIDLNLLHMGMHIHYSWKIYPLPEELDKLRTNPQVTPNQFVEFTSQYTKKNQGSMGEAKEEYDADWDFEQEVDMEDLGEGEFLIAGRGFPAYPKDWNMKRQASVAGFPFTVRDAKEMATSSAMADPNSIEALKKQAEAETDPKKKQMLLDQVKDMESREASDQTVITLAQKDAADTKVLIEKAAQLRKFIKDDRDKKISFSGDKDHDPFMFRLKAFDPKLYALYILIREIFDYRYDDIAAIDEYTVLMEKQHKELTQLEARSTKMLKNDKLNPNLPVRRCVAALVKKEDGNLVPLLLMLGHHKESDPNNANEKTYKFMLLDVTFDSKKEDMTYVGDDAKTEDEAIKNAFIEFGNDNKYGNGEIVYRVAGTSFSGNVQSKTTAIEYLGYALAVIGIVLLIAGAILSGGTLAPASAGAIGGIVSALGIATAVAGAALAARNIHKRVEKGTFEMDAQFALDVVSIIGAYAQVVGTAGRVMTTMTRGVGALQKAVTIQRLDKLLLIYDGVELVGNGVLVGLKVQEDVEAVKKLNLPKDKEDEMMQQIAMEAVQQGAMIAFASFSKVKDVTEHISIRIERSRYKSFQERGWLDASNNPTDQAPPFIRNHQAEPGKPPSKAQQGEQAWKETKVLDMATKPTLDKEHNLTVTENGRIIRCSDYCSDLRMKYNETLDKDPWLNKEMAELEVRAQEAAKNKDTDAAKKVADDAATFEGKLKEADDLRKHLFGMTDKEIDAALESLEAGKVTGGAKSGYKIDDTRIPKRQRRQIDVNDIMTEDELKELGKGGYKKAMDRINSVMGKKISDIAELKKAWDEARKSVLKGKEVTDYKREEVIKMYKDAQRKFWENIRKDPAAVEFLKKHGFELDGESGAAMAVLGPQGKSTTERGNITNQERRISLDHIEEKAQGDNWKKALDADNLELMFQNANSWKEIVQVKFGMREEVQ